jgi:serine/threonine protein kinase
VLEFGVENNIPFLVMGFAPHGSLRNRYPQGTKVELAYIVSYVNQISDALHYAHTQKLVHRDIKPENILLSAQDDALLSDFGIAIIAQSSKTPQMQEVVGTMAYMAPEQLQGKPVAASDQYALGIIVYEWLCGERPFQGTFTELFSQHMAVPPPPLHERFPFISPEVEHVVMVALSKQPQDRFANIKAFANAFEQACKERGIIALDALTRPAATPIPTPPPPPQQIPSAPTPVIQATPQISSSPPYTPQYSTIPQPSTNTTPPLPLNTPVMNEPHSGTVSGQSTIIREPAQVSAPMKPPKARVSAFSIILSIIALLVIISSVCAFTLRPAFLFGSPSPQPTAVQSNNSGDSANASALTATATAPTPDATGTASSYATSTATDSPTTTATTSPTTTASSNTNYHPGQLIYQAKDWTTWQGSAQWKVVDASTYGSDGTDDGSSGKQYTTWAPPGLNLPQNYEIQATITFVRSTDNSNGAYEVDLLGRGDGTSNGYGTGVYYNPYCSGNCKDAAISLIGIGSDNSNGIDTTRLTQTGYTLDTTQHTFKADFQGNTIKFYIDGTPYGSTTDNTYLDGGRVGLRVYKADVNVKDFKVIAL